MGRRWPQPSPPCWESAQPEQGGRQETAWGQLYKIAPVIHKGCPLQQPPGLFSPRNSFYSPWQLCLITNRRLIFKKKHRKLLCILFFLRFLFTGHPLADVFAVPQSRQIQPCEASLAVDASRALYRVIRAGARAPSPAPMTFCGRNFHRVLLVWNWPFANLKQGTRRQTLSPYAA